MRPLTIIVIDAAPVRFHAAIELAMAHQALGGAARLFLSGNAVTMLTINQPDEQVDDPQIALLVREALDFDVAMIACQSGMAATNVTMADFDRRVQAGGLVSLLADLGDARLVTI